jgi:3-methylcrotonyl-CoA carboxylase alpha subunit
VSGPVSDAGRVLIANRGEIARRIIRSCRRLGLETVAVYSEADAASAHVEDADQAHCIGKPRAQESYLLIERILEAARTSGAGLVHPGYGFLSENAAFARAVGAAGLVWIGPHPDQIEMMGDKQRAREAAMAAGVPILPGSARFVEGGLQGIEEAAAAVGFPLLVKAAAGGGGIGMRRVDAPDKLAEVAAAAQSMAARAFGDGAIYFERYVPHARHVEIQVFGFGDGRAVHFFERDCSVQRRFQKVIEECPAPGLPAELTQRMAKTAVALARAVKYAGAGTVEYVVDADTLEFFFLEMNTRIQVEHAVTEMVTGADLVAMQIEFARGRLDRMDQNAIMRKGCSIECRLYAENPAKMFMPSPGVLGVFRFPEQSATLRIDSGYREGDQVTPYYDPLIAKIIAWGEDRAAAIANAADALKSTRVEGIKTNREFLVACLEDTVFASGRATTRFIDERGKLLLEAAALTATR